MDQNKNHYQKQHNYSSGEDLDYAIALSLAENNELECIDNNNSINPEILCDNEKEEYKCKKMKYSTNITNNEIKNHNNINFAFFLNKISLLSPNATKNTLSLSDLIFEEKNNPILACLFENFMFDINFLLEELPFLYSIKEIHLVIGASQMESLQKNVKAINLNCFVHGASLPFSYGTHHSKMFILLYHKKVRVCIHTANYIYQDWNLKNQGIWYQDFYLKNSINSTSQFEKDLCLYLSHLPPSLSTFIEKLKNFDYRTANVSIVASVPGYHKGQYLHQWGHMKLRSLLKSFSNSSFSSLFNRSNILIGQFSSLGSINEKWLQQFINSSQCNNIKIIWPTVQQVRDSIEGYDSGFALCVKYKNITHNSIRSHLYHYSPSSVSSLSQRISAMPHIKTYLSLDPISSHIQWLLLTSANLSISAWGQLQKDETQLFIRSYELGILFHSNSYPLYNFTHLYHDNSMYISSESEQSSLTDLVFPLPYNLNPDKYPLFPSLYEQPWCQDKIYEQNDIFNRIYNPM